MKLENICPSPVETFVYPRNFKDKVPFVSEDCEFTPCGWGKIDGLFYPLGYKIVTEDLKSLGLRKNPNILTFPVGTWVMLPSEEVMVGKDDCGGIWSAISKGSIKTLKQYMLDMYGKRTRAFLTAISRPVFTNSYRIKSQGVMLLTEIY